MSHIDHEINSSLQVDEAELPVVLEFLKDIGRLSTKQGGKVQSKYLFFSSYVFNVS